MSYEDDYIRVCAEEGDEFLEFPKEADSTVLLSTLQSQFPNAIGLKYRGSSGAWRSLRVQDNVMDAPKEGWGDMVYCVTLGESNKRKAEDSGAREGGGESKRSRGNLYLQDMAVMNLPFETTEDELRDYFESNYGELGLCQIKTFRETGKSRGYGFVKFKDEESAKEAVNGSHSLKGRKIELKMKQEKPLKLFVGRLTDSVTETQLQDHFSKYGTLSDVYIPKPFKNFAFITFASEEDGKAAMGSYNELDGRRLNVMVRKTPEEAKAEESRKTSYHSRGNDRRDDSRSSSNNSNNYTYTPGQSYSNSASAYSTMPPSATTQAPPTAGAGAGGSMDTQLKLMLMQYLAKN